MENRSAGAATVVAALILAAALVVAGLLVKGSLDGAAEEIALLREAVEASAAAPERRPQVARRARPDPGRRVEVSVDGSPAWGPDSAEVTVVEFSDFQCPFCARVWPTLQRLREEYPDEVRVVFKHLPLGMHARADEAAAAAEAAHRQGKFWEMHDAIFENPRDLSDERLLAIAREIGLDVDRFQQDMSSAEVKRRVEADTREAARLGVSGTPGFFINGRFLSGAQPYESFKRLIDDELERG